MEGYLEGPFDFAFESYRRPFKSPLKTSHGLWSVRAGVFVYLRTLTPSMPPELIGVGEIAPVPAFGTESLEQVVAYCQSLGNSVTLEELLQTPVNMPCTQFGLGTALESLESCAMNFLEARRKEILGSYFTDPFQDHLFQDSSFHGDKVESLGLPPLITSVRASIEPQESSRILSEAPLEASDAWVTPAKICGLLPAGSSALETWRSLWDQGHRTFKWKIGVSTPVQEWEVFDELMQQLPPAARLRLDANGGLSVTQTWGWLNRCDRWMNLPHHATLEYLEQPLSIQEKIALLDIAQHSPLPLALDESVALLEDLMCWQDRHWPGVYCLKPAIMGFPHQIREVCCVLQNPKIFSSVFEATIGRASALSLARTLSTPHYALGFGVDHWLAESPKVSMSNSIFS